MHLTLIEASITSVSFGEIDIFFMRKLPENPLPTRVIG